MELLLDTEYGQATLWWDDRPELDAPGWVLRYHLAPEGVEDALGRRHLDEPLDPDISADDTGRAQRAALEVLGREGVGAGQQVTSAGAAEIAGLKDAASWRGTAWRPQPDGHHDGRTPWWWESTIVAAQASRPGRGARTDLTA